MSLLIPPAALHTAEYTTEPTGPDRSLVATRCEERLGVRSDAPTPWSARSGRTTPCARASPGAPSRRWPTRTARPSRHAPPTGRGRLTLNHCARSKPLPSKNSAPSSSSCSWNGAVRSGRATPERLERVDQVVDLVVVAGAARAHIRARVLDRLEAVDVHLVDVEAGVAVGDPVGHHPPDATTVGDPDGLGDPGAADPRRRSHDREPVRREREHPVERVVEGRGGERREQPTGVGPGRLEVLRRPRA